MIIITLQTHSALAHRFEEYRGYLDGLKVVPGTEENCFWKKKLLDLRCAICFLDKATQLPGPFKPEIVLDCAIRRYQVGSDKANEVRGYLVSSGAFSSATRKASRTFSRADLLKRYHCKPEDKKDEEESEDDKAAGNENGEY